MSAVIISLYFSFWHVEIKMDPNGNEEIQIIFFLMESVVVVFFDNYWFISLIAEH